jgi:small subunit ribosomal protein S17
MQGTILVEVERRTPHKLYGKLLKRSKKYKVDAAGQTVSEGEIVKIVETKPVSKSKHFKLMEKGKKGQV